MSKDPLIARRVRALRQGLADDACWPWDGTVHYKGYGLMHGGVKAHRESYAHFVGPIPRGFVVDHDCHNRDGSCRGGVTCPHRRCVNPSHLTVRSSVENSTVGFRTRSACRNGHERTAENTAPGGHCLLCKRVVGREHNHRRRRAEGRPVRLPNHCWKGHELTSENSYVARSGKRSCKTCAAARRARRSSSAG